MSLLRPLLSAFVALSLLMAPAAYAQSSLPRKAAVDKAELDYIAQELRKIKWFNARPNLKADFYVFLKASSSNEKCLAELPNVAKVYEEMKEDGRVELLLISYDRNKSMAQRYLESINATFPTTLYKTKGVADLTGVKEFGRGAPYFVVVRANGTPEVCGGGVGGILSNWRYYTVDRLKNPPRPGEADK